VLQSYPGSEGRRRCQAGQHWEWDGVRFSLLYPPARHYRNTNFSDNDRSCVLRVEGAGGATLLLGDIERLAEMTLLEEQVKALPARAVVVPHHGSAGSSSVALLGAIRPEHALISAGYHNRFGHPRPEVLQRYRELGARIWRTDRQGAVQLRVGHEGVWGITQVEQSPRYWHAR
jgi:competence protein ComEC